VSAVLDPDKISSLDDDESYVKLEKRKTYFQNNYRWIAIAPFAVVLFVGLRFFPNSQRALMLPIVASLFWAMGVAGYAFALLIQCQRFRCPRCGWRFGGGDTCGSCSLSRHSVKAEGAITAS
jgi:hypothetical protein